MNCQLIHIIFSRSEPFCYSLELGAQIEVILELGRVKGISLDFMSEICYHPSHTSQIFWQEIPILRIRCLGAHCDFEVFNNTQNILFYLIQPVIQHQKFQYASLLVDLRLPSWKYLYEFLLVLNRSGSFSLCPTRKPLSAIELSKLNKQCKIQAEKKIEKKKDHYLLDAITPNPFPNSDFRIFIQ